MTKLREQLAKMRERMDDQGLSEYDENALIEVIEELAGACEKMAGTRIYQFDGVDSATTITISHNALAKAEQILGGSGE